MKKKKRRIEKQITNNNDGPTFVDMLGSLFDVPEAYAKTYSDLFVDLMTSRNLVELVPAAAGASFL